MINEKITSGKVSSTTVATNITAYKRNEIGMLTIWGASVAGNASGITLCTLPVGYRPCGNVSFNYSNGAVRGNVYPDGKVAAWNSSSSTIDIYCSATYILA